MKNISVQQKIYNKKKRKHVLRSDTEQRLLRLEKLCATIKINYTIAFVMIGHQTYHLQEVEKPKYVRTKKIHIGLLLLL